MSTIRPIVPPLQFHMNQTRAQLIYAQRLVDEGPISDMEFWEDLSRTLTEAFSQLSQAQDLAAAAEADGRLSGFPERGPGRA